MIAELTRRAVQEFGPGAQPIDYLRDWVENGRTLLELANELTDHLRLKVSRSMLSNYITSSEERRRTLAEARVEGAGAMADRAVAILDDKGNDDDRELLQANRARADVRLKTAAFMNRAVFGNQPTTAVQVNIGGLHLLAHREREKQRLAAREAQPALPPGEVVVEAHDVEIVAQSDD